MKSEAQDLGWVSIIRLGLVQTALGGIVVLTTSTLNRVMVVELALAAMLPGILVGLHSALQISRPLWGHLSDARGRRTPWIIGGMALLAVSGALAAKATALMADDFMLGLMVAVVAYLLIGVGVGAAGTSLLALLAAEVRPERKAPAAAIVWIMMIFGFIVTTATVGSLLDPFSYERLVSVTSAVCAVAFLLSVVALLGVERTRVPSIPSSSEASKSEAPKFMDALKDVLQDRDAFAFTVFVFVSMLAYNTQDLILEPFAGAVFGFTPGESTKLTSVQHSGVLIGMILVAVLGGRRMPSESRVGAFLASLGVFSTKAWAVGGCLLSGAVLFGLAASGYVAQTPEVLRTTVGVLGFANGAFAVAAIGWMMGLAGAGGAGREGIRMGLWGGAQAIAFALGGFAGTLGVDLVRYTFESPVLPYATVFVVEGWLFVAAAILASRLRASTTSRSAADLVAASFSPEDAPSSSALPGVSS